MEQQLRETPGIGLELQGRLVPIDCCRPGVFAAEPDHDRSLPVLSLRLWIPASALGQNRLLPVQSRDRVVPASGLGLNRWFPVDYHHDGVLASEVIPSRWIPIESRHWVVSAAGLDQEPGRFQVLLDEKWYVAPWVAAISDPRQVGWFQEPDLSIDLAEALPAPLIYLLLRPHLARS